MSAYWDKVEEVNELSLQITEIKRQRTRLKKALKRAMKNWSDASKDWDSDQEKEWQRFLDITKEC